LRLFTEMHVSPGAVEVRIGSELQDRALDQAALVGAVHGAGSVLRILGPSRLHYVTGISTVQAIARYVSRYLECPPATPGHQGQRTSPSATSCSCTPARPTRPDSPVRTPHRERRLLRSARRLPRRLDRGDQEGVPEARAYPPPGREPRPGCRRAVQARLPGL